MLAVYSG